MKKGFWNRLKTIVAPAGLAFAMVAFAPAAALAANHGGSGGRGGGFNAAATHGDFNGGRAYVHQDAHAYSGRAYAYRGGGSVYGGRAYVGPRYRPGFGFGVGVGVYPAYGYAGPAYAPPAVCNPAGFYDQAGNWQYYQGCVPPQPPPNGDQDYGAGGPSAYAPPQQ